MVRETPARLASWLHKQHPRFRPLILSVFRLIPSIILSAAFITSFFDFEISNYIGIAGALAMILISLVAACLKVQQTKDENTALVKTFHFVKKKLDRKTKLGVGVSNKDISDILGTFCEMTLQREVPLEVPSEVDEIRCATCNGKGCPKCKEKTKNKCCTCGASVFGIVLTVLRAIRSVVNDFVPGWLLMTYIKDLQRIHSVELFSSTSGATRLESWHTFTDFEKAIEILEACGIFIGLLSNLVYTFVHCFQLCRCGRCRVRDIEDRIKRIGRNPICRDDTEIKVQKDKENTSTENVDKEVTDVNSLDATIDDEEDDNVGIVNEGFVDENAETKLEEKVEETPTYKTVINVKPSEENKEEFSEVNVEESTEDTSSHGIDEEVVDIEVKTDNYQPNDSTVVNLI